VAIVRGTLASLALVLAMPATAGIVGAVPAAQLGADDHRFLDELQRASFRFFEEQTHPRTHLVSDRAFATGGPRKGKASIASSGFALAGWTIAVERGWVTRDTALERVRAMLRFLAREAPRRHGFFYHFMEAESGARAWECEVSPIDTSLLLFGAIVAREYFGDPEVTGLVNGIAESLDWPWMLNGGGTLASSWRDETGFSRHRWSNYSEHLGMNLLALGSPTHPLPAATWNAWKRQPAITYGGRHFLAGAPLFIHQFSHAYVDFREQRDAFADYERNSVLATLAHRQFCLELASRFPSWGEKLWGVTASDSARGYLAWGGPPRSIDGGSLDGTLVPCAAAGSLPFAPRETLLTLRHMRESHGARIWKHYGFVDAFNPDSGWVAPDVIGIDVGITLIQAENARTGHVWALFMRAPEVRRGLARAGFVTTRRALTSAESGGLRELAGRMWRTLANEAIVPGSAGLQLGALLGARALGLVPEPDAEKSARAWLAAANAPADEVELAHHAAALVTLRRALPALATEATERLTEIQWGESPPASPELGSARRLATFLQVAARTRPPEAWAALTRTPVPIGPVHVLAPATVPDQLLAGLWLDEREVMTGASAAQLAYARRETGADPLTFALLVEHFPALAAASPTADGFESGSARDRAALVIALANTLADGGGVRGWFQQDPLTQAGRRAIPEFAEAAFGANNAIVARRELAGPSAPSPRREAIVRRATLPVTEWDWQMVDGLAYRDSNADVRPGDPALSLRFAFAWDEEALVFHAETMDAPSGSDRPDRRREAVELLVDPRGDGFAHDPAEDRAFSFLSNGAARDLVRRQPLIAEVVRRAEGFSVQARITWEQLGMKPAPGVRFGATAAVQVSGPRPHQPSLKLTWRRVPREDGASDLGVLVLAP